MTGYFLGIRKTVIFRDSWISKIPPLATHFVDDQSEQILPWKHHKYCERMSVSFKDGWRYEKTNTPIITNSVIWSSCHTRHRELVN